MKPDTYPTRYPSLSLTYAFIFAIGLACMGVAGFFLIQGLSQFAGNDASRNMLITGGVLFQITESVCFIAAAALTYHSLTWRYILFSLGSVLFVFSIGVMTLAQKTALQTGEAQASAIDEKRAHLRDQIASIENVIISYRFNAEKQSRSIYKDSRALGQDSINRAADMEERKMRLSEELFTLNQARRQTSADFFHRLQEVTGLPEKSAEFYFLVFRSLLLEMSGIILMSFGANLRAYKQLVIKSGLSDNIQTNSPLVTRIMARMTNTETGIATQTVKPLPSLIVDDTSSTKSKPEPTQKTKPDKTAATKKADIAHQTELPIETGEPEEADEDITQFWQSPDMKSSGMKAVGGSGQQLNYLMTMVADLHEQKLLTKLDPEAIIKGLNRYCSENISPDTAGILSKMINNRLDESC